MSKVTLNDLANLQNENTAVATINGNSATIETAFDNTISRDGSSPNQMEADLDMNSNDIINANGVRTTHLYINGEEVVPSDIAVYPPIDNNEIVSNISGVTTSPIGNTLTSILDATAGNETGMILTRGTTSWETLSPGASGKVLQSNGPSTNLTWETPSGGGSTTSGPFSVKGNYTNATATTVDVSVGDITHTYDTIAAASAATIPSVNNVVRTLGYSAAGDGGGTLYNRAASEPTHPAKFQSADGAWWELASKKWIDVRWVGGKVDGSTDDTQAYRDAATVMGNTGTIYVPCTGAGSKITDTVTFSGPVKVVGDGAWRSVILVDGFVATKAAFEWYSGSTSSFLHNGGISGIYFVQTGGGNSGFVANVRYMQDSDFSDIWFEGMNGFQSRWGWNNVYRRIRGNNCPNFGWVLNDNDNDNAIEECACDGTSSTAVAITVQGSNRMTRIIGGDYEGLVGANAHAILVSPNLDTAGAAAYVHKLLIQGVYFENDASTFISLNPTTSMGIRSCTISDCSFFGQVTVAPAYAIFMKQCSGIYIERNIFQAFTTGPIFTNTDSVGGHLADNIYETGKTFCSGVDTNVLIERNYSI